MKRVNVAVLIILGLGLLTACQPAPSTSELLATIVFDSAKDSDEEKLYLSEISSDFPTDWSSYEALVIELRASSPQRMNLKIYTGPDTFSRVLLHPYPEVWVRAALPIAMLAKPPSTGHDMAAVGNRSRPGYFVSLWGPFVTLGSVESLAFEMEQPVDSPQLEIRSIELAETSPGNAVLSGTPLVDDFGQFVHSDWPHKVSSVEELKQGWEEEESTLTAGKFGYCEYGGYENTDAEATGFFRVEQIEGKWWFVDPDGHLFLSAGSDVIQPYMVTRLEDRRDFFKTLPPEGIRPDRERDGDRGISFLTWNLHRRFGADWVEPWIDLTLRRMDAWGLNTVANWSDQRLWDSGRKAYAIPLASWQTETSYLGLPDVYSDEFSELVDERAQRQCAPRKDDPWLLGYFLANEPPFPQKASQTVDLILQGPATATQEKLRSWLEEGDTPERREEFIAQAFDRYIQLTSAAVKKYDPNHLNLGMRSGGRPTAAEIEAARAFDVYSVNVYNYEVTQDRVRQISELTGKPMLIGEFHFGTPARGLAASLVQVANHAERGVAYRYYVEQAFSMPEMIGTHWFQWVDQPATGRFDGENYNIGLIDVTDRPYPEMIEALKDTHRRLYQVHSGEIAPYATEAKKH